MSRMNSKQFKVVVFVTARDSAKALMSFQAQVLASNPQNAAIKALDLPAMANFLHERVQVSVYRSGEFLFRVENV